MGFSRGGSDSDSDSDASEVDVEFHYGAVLTWYTNSVYVAPLYEISKYEPYRQCSSADTLGSLSQRRLKA